MTSITLSKHAALVNAANGRLESSLRTSLGRALELGRALAAAKAAVGHGRWLEWLAQNTTVSARTSERWINLSTLWQRKDQLLKCDTNDEFDLAGLSPTRVLHVLAADRTRIVEYAVVPSPRRLEAETQSAGPAGPTVGLRISGVGRGSTEVAQTGEVVISPKPRPALTDNGSPEVLSGSDVLRRMLVDAVREHEDFLEKYEMFKAHELGPLFEAHDLVVLRVRGEA